MSFRDSERWQAWWPLGLVCIWLVVQSVWSFPDEITDDWMGWRQADTQSIAENFITGDGRILYPQINWGGDGPGYVETEFQLMTWLISMVMRVTGTSERPGLYLSVLAMGMSGLILYQILKRKFGWAPALFGLAVFLGMRGPVFLSSTVQPDALCFLFYCLAFGALLSYLEHQRSVTLLVLAGATILAALVKVTSLHLGIFQFLAVALCAPRLLRRPGLWLAWFGILFVVGLYLWHSNHLYQVYGNTFGVIAGGDSKFATLQTLLVPTHYPSLIRLSLVWGFGAFGAVAIVVLLLVKRLDRIAISLGLANLIYLLVAFRYTSNEWNGPHYHLFTSVLGVWVAAGMFAYLQDRLAGHGIRVVWAAISAIACVALYGLQLGWRHDPNLVLAEKDPVIAMGKALKKWASPGTLVVVRSSARARDEEFGTENNFEDPRIFYLAGVRGWVLPANEDGLEDVRKAVARGAKYYIDPFRKNENSELDVWLQTHGEKVMGEPGKSGRIFRLLGPTRPMK